MNWSDTLRDAVGSLVGGKEQQALPNLIQQALGADGLQDILGKPQNAGFAAQVASWLDKNRDNLPISPEQLRAALGDQHVQQIARSLGIPLDAVLEALSKYLPAAVNAAGPAAAPNAA